MSNVAYLPIEADRYGACVRQIYIRGLDLTGVAMRAQVRLAGDTPGAPLVDLQTVTNANAEGLRLVEVTVANGVATSHVELVINETTLEGLPYAGELGSATALAWDCQLTIAGRKQRLARGEFTITGDGVTGADNAPANRPLGWSTRLSAAAGMRTGATLTFGDEMMTVNIDGANLVAAQVDRATSAQDRAEAAQQKADLSAGAAQGAARYFTTRAAGEAASAVNQAFATDDGAGNVVYYRRTAGGSVEIGRAVTPAALSASTGAGRVGYRGRTVAGKLADIVSVKDFGAVGDGAADDTAAFQTALAIERDVQVTPGVFPTASTLSPLPGSVIRGTARESAFVRGIGSGKVFAGTANFVTYQDMTIDRGGAATGYGIDHSKASPTESNPLEGFKLRRCNVSGHSVGVRLRDAVIASLEDFYAQSCATGIELGITSSEPSTMVAMRQGWLRENTDYGLNAINQVGLTIDQVAFEKNRVGMRLAACADVLALNAYWERNKQPSEITNCPSTAFYSGNVDGAPYPGGVSPDRQFYFNNGGTPGTHVFDGAWRVDNLGDKFFGTADMGATIYVRAPALLPLKWQAVNGGRVIFECSLVGSTTWGPDPALAKSAIPGFREVTVPGATEGDFCRAQFFNGSADPAGFIFTAACIAPNVVRVFGFNTSDVGIGLDPGRLVVTVQKQPLDS